MPIIQGNTQDSVKINGLTSRLIDRKAIKERGEVAQGCQEVGQSNRRLMPTWLQGLRRGIRSLLTSAWRSYESPMTWPALFTVRVLIFSEASLFRRRAYQPQHDSVRPRQRGKLRPSSLDKALPSTDTFLEGIIWLGQRGPRPSVLVKCPDGKIRPVGSARMLVSRAMAGPSPFDSPLL